MLNNQLINRDQTAIQALDNNFPNHIKNIHTIQHGSII